MRTLRIATLLITLPLLLPVAVTAQAQGRAYGDVTDPGGEPLVGVKVEVLDPASHNQVVADDDTNEGGSYAVVVADATRPYIFRLSMDGYQPVEQEVNIPIGRSEKYDWMLAPAPAAQQQPTPAPGEDQQSLTPPAEREIQTSPEAAKAAIAQREEESPDGAHEGIANLADKIEKMISAKPSPAPRGVRLTTRVGTQPTYIYWRASIDKAAELIGDEGFQTTLDNGTVGWMPGSLRPDLGLDYYTEVTTILRFYKDEFYGYAVRFEVDEFDFVLRGFTKALGEPDDVHASVVHNRMGADFDQEVRTWVFPEVRVALSKRASKVDESMLIVSYLPIEELVPDSGGAPVPF